VFLPCAPRSRDAPPPPPVADRFFWWVVTLRSPIVFPSFFSVLPRSGFLSPPPRANSSICFRIPFLDPAFYSPDHGPLSQLPDLLFFLPLTAPNCQEKQPCLSRAPPAFGPLSQSEERFLYTSQYQREDEPPPPSPARGPAAEFLLPIKTVVKCFLSLPPFVELLGHA